MRRRTVDVVEHRQRVRVDGRQLTVSNLDIPEVGPDGRQILTAGNTGDSVSVPGTSVNHHPNLWDARTGQILVTLQAKERSTLSAAFSADGATTFSWGGCVEVTEKGGVPLVRRPVGMVTVR